MRILTPFEDRVGSRTPVTPVGLGAGASAGVAGRICPAVRDWRLDKKLGTGSTAYVYAATNLTDGRRAALKILRAHVDESTQRRFLREGYVANAVGHPGVVQIFDQGITEEGELFIVMELLDGESLDSLRTRSGGKLPVRQVIDIGCELLDILGVAHARRVIHRDLKPANIWVGKDGKLKVLDFGLAYIAEHGRSSSITGTGVMMGTPAFMPPEQARGRRDEVDARSDLWALGATLFALVAGRAVHVAASHPGQMLAVLTRPAPSLHSVAPHVPRAVAAVIDRALAFERDDRWPDAESMAEALRWARIGLDGGATPAPPRATHFDAASTPVTPVRTADVTDDAELDSDEKTRVASYAFSTLSTDHARAADTEDDAADAPVEETKLHVSPMSFARAPDVSAPPPVAPWPPPTEPRSGSIATSVSTGPHPHQVRPPEPGFLNGTVAAGIAAGVIAGALALGLIIATERFHKRPTPTLVAAPPPQVTATAIEPATEAEPPADLPAATAAPTESASELAAPKLAAALPAPPPAPKAEAKPAPKPEAKSEPKAQPKPEDKPEPPARAAATADPKPEPERDDTSPLDTEGRPREL